MKSFPRVHSTLTTMLRRIATASLLLLSLLSPLQGQEALSLEADARRLLDAELFQSGDWGATFEDTLAFVRSRPDHPLAEAAIALLGSRQDVSPEPRRLAEELLGNMPALSDPAARWRAERLVGGLAVAFCSGAAELKELGDAFPGYLSRGWVRGPLGPLARPLATGEDPSRLLDPGPGEERQGLHGPVSWQPVERSPLRRWFSVHEALRQGRGHAQLLLPFVVEGGGPAHIELEVDAVVEASPRDGDEFRAASPRHAFSINGGPVEQRDLALEEGRRLERLPVVLRDGVNWIVLETPLVASGRCRFAVRVLGEDGLPHAGLRAAEQLEGLELGEEVTAIAPLPLEDVKARLAGIEQRGPWCTALLGILHLLDGDSLRGHELLARAHEQQPEANVLAVLLATATLRAGHLPEGWRRSRARELLEAVSERDPDHYTSELVLATILAGEDREEEALAELESLALARPGRSEVPLARRRVLEQLGLAIAAEEALAVAAGEEPGSTRVRNALANHAQAMGQARTALALGEHVTRADGSPLEALGRLAGGRLREGNVAGALEIHEELVLRSPGREAEQISTWIQLGRLDEARALLERRAAEFPRSLQVRTQLANVALRAGDREAELRWLREAHALDRGDVAIRERLVGLGEADPARSLARAELSDAEAALLAYDPDTYSDSLVFVVDEAVRYVFEDGAWEQVTQNLYHLRDLQAVEALGSLNLSGADVLELATIEPDGTRLEPIEVAGEYVLPSLDPGDFVHVVTRVSGPAPSDGRVSPETWFFASTDEPFHRSSYTISVPTELGLRFVEKNLEGLEREVVSQGEGRELRRYVARGMERVLAEPAMPPRERFLPNLSVGMDRDLEALLDFQAQEARWYTQVTPELAAAAREASAGAEGQSKTAAQLFAALRELIDERDTRPFLASHTLLSRRGNPAFLYVALLHAVGIEAELVWSRAVAPGEDEDPEPDFVTFERYRRQLLVRVQPDDGPEAWCDPSVEFLPYGQLMGDAPGAEAIATGDGERIHLPDAPLSERPSVRVRGEFVLSSDRSAAVSGRVELLAGAGFGLKEQLRDLPANQRQLGVRQVAGQRLPGLEVQDFALPGLDTDDQPVALEASGRMRSFLDREGSRLVARLPLVPMNLSGIFADEGERRLPFRFGVPLVEDVELDLVLPADLQLVEPFEPVEQSCPGGSYRLALEQVGEGRWRLSRKLAIGAFELPAEGYGDFLAFCRAVDNAERGRLQLEQR